MRVLTHSGRYNSHDCPTLGCSRSRDTRIQVDFADGRRRVVTACAKHVSWHAARAVMRVVAMGGQEAVEEFVDRE